MSAPRLIAVTGGPGAGKTAVLEVVRRHFSRHVVVLQEAASIVFGGGFPRRDTAAARRAAQRAIFRVQRELEQLALDEGCARVMLCDRGTVDGEAYWPAGATTLWEDLGLSRHAELARYATVIHLRPPPDGHGYNHDNALRIETATQAREIDERIARAWSGHPRRTFVESTECFTEKLTRVLELVHGEIAGEAIDAAPPDVVERVHGGAGSAQLASGFRP